MTYPSALRCAQLSDNAARYSAERFLDCIEPGLSMNAGIFVEQDRVLVTGERIPEFVFPRASDGWIFTMLQTKKPGSYCRSFDDEFDIPLPSKSPLYTISGRHMVMMEGLLEIVFLLLARAEECFLEKRDPYGRFCFKDSFLCQWDAVDFPLIDEYAAIVRKGMGYPGKTTPKGRIIPTHDIDHLEVHFSDWIKEGAKDILRRKNIRSAFCWLFSWLKYGTNKKYSPEVDGIRKLMRFSQEQKLVSHFYFLGGKTKEGWDDFYNLQESCWRTILQELHDAGCPCGFHASRLAFRDRYAFKEELSQVRKAIPSFSDEVRQHYLCFDAAETPDIWEEAGLKADYTLGFHDREGFRCGTCRPYPLFSLNRDCKLNILEHPLIVMESTLQAYQKLNISESLDRIMNLKQRVMVHGGEFIILFHNSFIRNRTENWFRGMYCKVIQEEQ